jgi:lipopolysaccharide transport system permease protein
VIEILVIGYFWTPICTWYNTMFLLYMSSNRTVHDIQPVKGWSLPNWAEIWEYKELLYFLTWRDLKLRYKQTALGVGWAIIPSIVNMVIFSFVFGALAKLPSEGVPYAVFAYTGLVPWGLFSAAMSGASNSLITGAAISAKVYFPRLISVFSSVFSSIVDSLIPLVILFGLMLWFGIFPTERVVFVPLWLLFGALIAIAVGLWLAALSAQFRDVGQAVPLLVSIWMYASPVAYSPELLPTGSLSNLYWLNPMAIVIQGFRWTLLGSALPPTNMIIASITLVIILFFGGLLHFHRIEKTFVDWV